jgi:hypothetical protein
VEDVFDVTTHHMNTKPLLLCLLALNLSTTALADSGGSDWSTSYGFAGAGKHQTNLTQADLIAKRESGYYDGLGKTQVYNIATNSVGTMNTMTTTISGDSNSVVSDSLSSGSMDASVGIQSLTGSSISQNKTY